MEAGRIEGLEEIGGGMVSEVTEITIGIEREVGGSTEADFMEADAFRTGEGAGTGKDAWYVILFCVFGFAISGRLGVSTKDAYFEEFLNHISRLHIIIRSCILFFACHPF